MNRPKALPLAILWLSLVATVAACAAAPAAATPPVSAQKNPIPLFAYYYIWFDVGSWERAKTDYPLLGRYASGDAAVMRRHVQWAKAAGIDGFIVSWKSTGALNQRLAQLSTIAAEEAFELSVIYQGLDFERKPLPAERIAADLDYFSAHYAGNGAFTRFGKPLVIWSGTWEFSREDVARVTTPRRAQLLLLASERNLAGYERVADLVDGNAYYWSSVNPDTFPAYQEKLDSMSRAVHAQRGLWIAPAAPGFDARLIGGSTVVERKDGETLRREMDKALKSAPDAIGLISWNEFSENTQLEPSEQYGRRYLDLLASIQGTVVPEITEFDSSEPGDTAPEFDLTRVAALGFLAGLLVAGFVMIAGRKYAA